jgi:hypothetical protein
VFVTVMGMVVVRVTVSTATRLASTTGMFLRTVLVFALAAATIAGVAGGFGLRSTATTAVRFGRRVLGQKLLPAVVAAKVERLSIAFCVESGCFVHRHAADGVDSHINSGSFGCFGGVATAIQTAARDDENDSKASQST